MATNWDKVGGIASITGTVQGMIGSYYAAETEKYKYKSMALGYEHKKDMAKINSRMLERQAQQVGRAYNRQIMIKTMAAGQRRGKATASAAARGGSRSARAAKKPFRRPTAGEVAAGCFLSPCWTRKIRSMLEIQNRKGLRWTNSR